MRNSEVIRQWKVLRSIEVGRLTTIAELARELHVTDRTIRRDIEALQEAGFPIYDETADRRRVWRLLEPSRRRVMQGFTLSELAALYFGRNLMSFLGGSPLAQDLDSAFEKIRQALPERSLPYLERIQDLFAARPDPSKDYSRKRGVIESLIDAVLHQRRIKVDYFSFHSQRAKSYLLDPYRVVYFRGGLYVYARAAEYDEVRTFAVERIRAIDVLDSTFEMPKNFDVGDYARAAFGIAGGEAQEVELHFGAHVAGYIRERVWHESQELEEHAGGDVRLRLRVALGVDLRAWIKGFLPHVRVLRPAALREELARELAAAIAQFGADSPAAERGPTEAHKPSA
jgi:predicted DNA-binding transcriptional regulator YafY